MSTIDPASTKDIDTYMAYICTHAYICPHKVSKNSSVSRDRASYIFLIDIQL